MVVTLKDIALKANVSVATVSMVLNDKQGSRISKAKSEEIKRIARELKYVPNQNARSLVLKKTMTIGMIIPDLENGYFSSLAKRTEEILRKKGYALVIVNSNDSLSSDLELIEILASRSMDGILYTPGNESFPEHDKILKLFETYKLPVVFVDRVLSDDYSSVSFDDFMGSYLATKHVIKKGHKKIGYVSSSRSSINGMNRLHGYCRALLDHGLIVDENMIYEGGFNYECGYESVDHLMKTQPTAIITANDMAAYGVIKRLREYDLRIPNDISLVGYDNLMFSDILDVPLTSVEQDVEDIAQISVELLMKVIEEPRYVEKVVLRPKLIDKKSVLELK